ncbi:hypothetical protein N9Z64_02875, partial [bacterium]|nr:hypothetical protein [bacterium]
LFTKANWQYRGIDEIVDANEFVQVTDAVMLDLKSQVLDPRSKFFYKKLRLPGIHADVNESAIGLWKKLI